MLPFMQFITKLIPTTW